MLVALVFVSGFALRVAWESFDEPAEAQRVAEGDPSESLHLSPEDAEYLGIDMSVRERPETGM